MSVPAEINNTSMDAATVLYIEQTLGFHPDYWAIGNEPQGWTHFNIPWTRWQNSDASNTTPLQYAREVQQIVAAVRGVDPVARFIGIESADGGAWNNSQWLDEVATVDGPNLTALAIHPYPDGMGPLNPTNASFFAGLSVDNRFPNNYQGLQASVAAACACAVPIWVGEYNAALNGTYAPFQESYPEVAYMAAGIIGAIREGIPHVAVLRVPASAFLAGRTHGDPPSRLHPLFDVPQEPHNGQRTRRLGRHAPRRGVRARHPEREPGEPLRGEHEHHCRVEPLPPHRPARGIEPVVAGVAVGPRVPRPVGLARQWRAGLLLGSSPPRASGC